MDKISFFLGCNTADGFKSYFSEFRKNDMKLYLIKGGPGTGKSTFMKSCADELIKKGHRVEYIYCSSDPDSLDGFIDHNAEICMADATPPHVMEPECHGAKEITVPLFLAWDDEKLQSNKNEITDLSREISECHKKCVYHLKAGKGLIKAVSENVRDDFGSDEPIKTAGHIYETAKSGIKGEKIIRLLDAVSVDKVICFEQTARYICDNIYVIKDESGEIADKILKNIAMRAEADGEQIILCPDAIFAAERISHIIFPKNRVGIFTQNNFTGFFAKKDDEYIFEENFGKSYTKLIRDEFVGDALVHIKKASDWIGKAKKLHDKLEEYYISAMDFKIVDELKKNIMKKLY